MKLKLELLADGLFISSAGSLTRLLFPRCAQCDVALPISDKDVEERLYTACSWAGLEHSWEKEFV